MQSLERMIDNAAKVCTGGQAGLARRLGVKPQKVNDWKAGRVCCPWQHFAGIAAIAGEREPLAAYGAYRAERESRRQGFALASFAALALAACVGIAPDSVKASPGLVPQGDTSHIIRRAWRALLAAVGLWDAPRKRVASLMRAGWPIMAGRIAGPG